MTTTNTPIVGQRLRLTNPVDRYPHFIAAKGMEGTVTDVTADNISVRMDDHLDGAEEWDNEIVWSPCNDENIWDDVETIEAETE